MVCQAWDTLRRVLCAVFVSKETGKVALHNIYTSVIYADTVECWFLEPPREIKTGLRSVRVDEKNRGHIAVINLVT